MGLNDMTSPHNFDSSDDYFDSLLEPWELRCRDIMENDPEDFLTDEQIDSMIYDNFEAVWDMLDEKNIVYETVLGICKDEYEWQQEP